MIRATLISGSKSWTLIGAYIPPSETDGSTLEFISIAKRTAPSTRPLILLGDLNVNLQQLGSNQGSILNRRTETLALVTTLGLQDLHRHFWPSQRKYIGDWTWNMRREGTRIYSKCDYILTTEHSHFSNFKILTPRFDTDHRMVKGILRIDLKKNQKKYMCQRTRYPVRKPKDPSRADVLLAELCNHVKKRPPEPDSRKQSWISNDTWKGSGIFNLNK
jgi:hypothetical protein